jgi:hypothetical protein
MHHHLLFYFLNKLRKPLGVINGHIGQNLSVECYASFLEAMHQFTVRKTVDSCGSIYAGNPESPEITLLLLSIPVSIAQGFHDSLVSHSVQLAFRAEIALGKL